MVTTEQMVPPASPIAWEPPFDEQPRPQQHRWLWLASVGLLAIVVAALVLVQVPYYTLSPGITRPVDDLVAVEGTEAFPSEGEVLLTTVSLRHVTAFEALTGWLDRDVQVLHEDLLFPPDVDRTAFNAALMTGSKDSAVLVALRRLGFEVPERGQGALVVAVGADYPAADRLVPGDVLVEVDDAPVTTSSEAADLLGGKVPGEPVRLTVLSLATDRTREEVIAPVAEEGRAVLGVNLQTYVPEFDFPFEVDIDSGAIGGPSAGLAFTLAVIDALTPGELTGGAKVAVTGTIELDGSVGAVSGVAQKTVAVRDSGAKVFIVPASEADEARSRAGDDLTIVPVATLDEALVALAELGGNARELQLVAAG